MLVIVVIIILIFYPSKSVQKLHIMYSAFMIVYYPHLLGAFYFLLGNLSPRLRSKISNIQLLLLVRYNLVAEFGIDRVLQPIVDDIRKLESVYFSFFCIIIKVDIDIQCMIYNVHTVYSVYV